MSKSLEIELDYDLEPEEIEQHAKYVAAGMGEQEAWRQIAQDVLGASGAFVQGATAVEG